MSVAEATPDYEVGSNDDRAFLGHPKGLGYLGFTEGCERFSYYSMQTLLVLYMVNYLLVPGRMENVVGLNWLNEHVYPGLSGQPLASAIFGTYTALSPEWRLLVITGFCGGLTTFSTFSAEITALLQQGRVLWALGAAGVHLLGSILMTFAGVGTFFWLRAMRA